MFAHNSSFVFHLLQLKLLLQYHDLNFRDYRQESLLLYHDDRIITLLLQVRVAATESGITDGTWDPPQLLIVLISFLVGSRPFLFDYETLYFNDL